MAQANINIVLSNGKQAGQTINELRQTANRLTREINNLKPGTEEFVKKSQDLKQVGTRLGEVRKEAKGLQVANSGVLNSFAQYIPFGGTLQNIARGARTGVVAFKSLKAAIAATGIGLIVVAIASLVAWFQRTEAGAQKLRVMMAAVGQVFDSALDIITNLGEAIFAAFSNPKEAITQLWELIKQNVVNRITGVIDTFRFMGETIKAAFELDWEGVKENAAKAGESVLQTLTGVDDFGNKLVDTFGKAKDAIGGTFQELRDDAQAAMKLAEEENDLRVANRQFLIEEAQMRAQIAELRNYATDVTREDADRQAALAKAIELTNQVEAKKIALKAEQLRILKAQQEISITDEAGLEEAARLEAELISLQESRASSMRRLTSQESTLREQMNNQRLASEKKAADEELKIQQNLQDLKIEAMRDGMEKEIALKELQFERTIANLIGTEEQIREQEKLLEEIKAAEIRGIKDKYAAEQQKADDEAIAEREATEEAARKRQLEKDREQAEEAKEIRREQYAFMQGVTSAFSSFYIQDLDDQINALSQDEESRKKNAGRIKELQKAKIKVNLLNEIQGIWAGYSEFGPLQSVLAGVNSALAVFRANKAINKVDAQKFERGGILRGARHAYGGIKGILRSSGEPIEMEDGEIVLTRNVGMHPVGRRIASNLNAAFGGRKFEAGGPVSPFTSSAAGSAPDLNAAGLSGAAADGGMAEAMINEWRQFRTEISNWQRNLKVNNNLQDVRDGLGTLNNLQEDSEV
ncbi:hypothetical protein GBO34_00865 [Roseivirga pacifica]|uniref:hypothetical protein n=1 Tax=Roseivirga pacifica TaxID=1267423 RepID=UPI00209421B9|nr:hypothetical protein [Roseivirga pacifica]MCO6367864.1 hypothetical protein [Roseivirga pacifica]MCO6377236.1 hypothetical protein [Roseivirga pacifica]